MEDRIAAARAARQRKDFEESYRLWKELADEDPMYLAHCGWAAFKLGRWQEAQDALERAREFKPNAQILMQLLGHVWVGRTDKKDDEQFWTAEYWLLEALKRGKTAPILTVLGAVYAKLEDAARAIESFEDALKVDENYGEAMCNLAVLIGKDDPLRAISLLERAIGIDPFYKIAYRELERLQPGAASQMLERGKASKGTS